MNRMKLPPQYPEHPKEFQYMFKEALQIKSWGGEGRLFNKWDNWPSHFEKKKPNIKTL